MGWTSKMCIKIFFMDSDVWLCWETTLSVLWKCTVGEKARNLTTYGNSLNKISALLKQAWC